MQAGGAAAAKISRGRLTEPSVINYPFVEENCRIGKEYPTPAPSQPTALIPVPPTKLIETHAMKKSGCTDGPTCCCTCGFSSGATSPCSASRSWSSLPAIWLMMGAGGEADDSANWCLVATDGETRRSKRARARVNSLGSPFSVAAHPDEAGDVPKRTEGSTAPQGHRAAGGRLTRENRGLRNRGDGPKNRRNNKC